MVESHGGYISSHTSVTVSTLILLTPRDDLVGHSIPSYVCVQATIKTQMQAGVDSTFLGSIRDIVRRNGLKAFYAGLGPDLAQNLPYSALYIGT